MAIADPAVIGRVEDVNPRKQKNTWTSDVQVFFVEGALSLDYGAVITI